MTSHYDLKQQEKNNGVLVAGLGGGVTNIFVIYLGGGGRVFFSDVVGWVVKIFAYRMKM